MRPTGWTFTERWGRRCRPLLWSIALSAAALACAEEIRLDVPGAADAAVVRLPPEPADRSWPAIFFYHGMGGRPTVEPIASPAASSNFVLVGMPYVHREGAGHEQRWRDECRALDFARAEVARRVRLRPGAAWLGGISMGGWAAVAIGDLKAADWAGLLILLAGRPWHQFRMTADAWRGKTIYIGAGETDPNLAAARRAATFYRLAGAVVTFEVFPRVGHTVPPSVQGLDAWLDCRGRLDALDAAGRDEASAWFNRRMADVAEQADPWRRYELCRGVRDDPRLALAGPEAAARLNRAAAVLAAEPRVAADLAAEAELERCYAAGWRARRLDEIRAVRSALEKLAAAYPGTAAAGHARREIEVLAGIISASESAASAASREPPAPAVMPPYPPPARTRAVPPLRRR